MLKYRRKVFAMDERHLRVVLTLLNPTRRLEMWTKVDMQEEVVNWLVSQGLSLRHEFLFFEDDAGDVWLLSRNDRYCPCCPKSTEPSKPITNPSAVQLNAVRTPKRGTESQSSRPMVMQQPPKKYQRSTAAKSHIESPTHSNPPRRPSLVSRIVVPTPFPEFSEANYNKGQTKVVIREQPRSEDRDRLPAGIKAKPEKDCNDLCAECCSEFGRFCIGLLINMK